MASKIKMKSFNKKVEKIVMDNGGVSDYKREDGYHTMKMKTKAGMLSVTTFAPESSKVFSIFCCFDDPKKATEVLSPLNASNLNKHSGKWNYHCQEEQVCLDMFTSSLKEIV